jgi:hypothetical protein
VVKGPLRRDNPRFARQDAKSFAIRPARGDVAAPADLKDDAAPASVIFHGLADVGFVHIAPMALLNGCGRRCRRRRRWGDGL